MTLAQRIHQRLTGDSEPDRRELSERARRHEPRNFLLFMVASLGSKVGDELANPRLVLAWLLGTLGAPMWMVGWLVPIRDAGAMVPQIALAPWVRRLRLRKRAWLLGAILQSLGALAMALVALWGSGAVAGWCVLGALTSASLARALSSLASKDVLGRVVERSHRGTLSGWAGAIASGVGLTAGALLAVFDDRPAPELLATLLAGAAAGWLLNAAATAAVAEEPVATESQHRDGLQNTLREGWQLLAGHRSFRRYLAVRLLALASALALPYVALGAAAEGGGSVADLGLLVVVSGVVGMVAKPLWGRMADRSSPMVLAGGSALAALACAGAAATSWWSSGDRDLTAVVAALYGLLALAHAGVRVGRKTYLIDLADADNRALLVAVSNTIVGIALLPVGAVVGLVAALWGGAAALAGLAGCALVGAALAAALPRP